MDARSYYWTSCPLLLSTAPYNRRTRSSFTKPYSCPSSPYHLNSLLSNSSNNTTLTFSDFAKNVYTFFNQLKIRTHIPELLQGALVDHYPQAPKLTFADSNWVNYYLSFQINPITHKLDLYRSTLDNQANYPMTIWANQFQTNAFSWKFYTQPKELKIDHLDTDHYLKA